MSTERQAPVEIPSEIRRSIDALRNELPPPLADAIAVLLSGQRDLLAQAFALVGVVRALVHLLACLSLAAGRSRQPKEGQVATLLAKLDQQGHLTEGEWWALARDNAKAWRRDLGRHPLPSLVALVSDEGGKGVPEADLNTALKVRKELAHHGLRIPVWDHDPLPVEELPSTDLRALTTLGIEKIARVLVRLGIWSREHTLVAVTRASSDGAWDADQLRGTCQATRTWGWTRVVPSAAHGAPEVSVGRVLLVDSVGHPRIDLDAFILLTSARRPALWVGHSGEDALYDTVVFDEQGRRDKGRALMRGRLSLPTRDAAPPAFDEPFVGLRELDARYRRVLRGRDDDLRTLERSLRTSAVTVLTGVSGVGKSSMVYAGLLPWLEEARQIRAGVLSPSWWVIQTRPKTDALAELRRSVRDAVHALSLSETDVAEALASLDANPSTLASVVTRVQALTGRRPLLLVDQAEELFTLCRDEGVQTRYVAQLRSFVGNATEDSARLLLISRDDHATPLVDHEGLRDLPVSSRALLTLRVPGVQSLVAVLRDPVEALGWRFVDDDADAMVQTVINHHAALPLLQTVGRLLWERRDRDDPTKQLRLASLGEGFTMTDAIRWHAERVYKQIGGAREQDAMRALLVPLVTDDDTRRPVARTALLRMAGGGAVTAKVLGRLIDTERLLVARARERDDAVETVELAHDSLLREWATLRAWVRAAREARRRQRQLRLGGAVGGVLALALSLAAVFARLWQRSEAHARRAERQEQLAQESRAQAEQLVARTITQIEGTLAPAGRLSLLRGPIEMVDQYYVERERHAETLAPEEVHQRMVNLLHLGAYKVAVGEHAGAERLFRRVIALYEGTALAPRARLDSGETYADAWLRLGETLGNLGRPTEAIHALEVALARAAELRAPRQSALRFRLELAAHAALAVTSGEIGDRARSRSEAQRVASMIEHAPDVPEQREAQDKSIAEAVISIGSWSRERSNNVTFADRMLEIANRHQGELSPVWTTLRAVGVMLQLEAESTPRSCDADARLEEALRTLEPIHRAEPDYLGVVLLLISGRLFQGELHAERGQTTEAAEEYRKAISIGEEALSRRLTSIVLRSSVVNAHGHLASQLLGRGDLTGAMRSWRRALALTNGYPDGVDILPGVSRQRAWILEGIAWIHLRRGQQLLALDAFREAGDVLRRAADPDGSDQALAIARNQSNQAFALNTSGDHDRAEDIASQCALQVGSHVDGANADQKIRDRSAEGELSAGVAWRRRPHESPVPPELSL